MILNTCAARAVLITYLSCSCSPRTRMKCNKTKATGTETFPLTVLNLSPRKMRAACAPHSTTLDPLWRYKFLQLERILKPCAMKQSACESIQTAFTSSGVSALLRNFKCSASVKQIKTSHERRSSTPGRKQQVGMACIIDDKTCMLANTAAAFHYMCLCFQLHLFPTLLSGP